jgi:hypothetical protein
VGILSELSGLDRDVASVGPVSDFFFSLWLRVLLIGV